MTAGTFKVGTVGVVGHFVLLRRPWVRSVCSLHRGSDSSDAAAVVVLVASTPFQSAMLRAWSHRRRSPSLIAVAIDVYSLNMSGNCAYSAGTSGEQDRPNRKRHKQ
jgi:hypothetical protein